MNKKTQVKKKPQQIISKEARYQSEDPLSIYTTGAPIYDPLSDFLDAYSAHVWVYACVRAIATNIASIEFLPYIQKQTPAGLSWIENPNHPFYDLMKNPNPYMAGYNLRENLVACLKLTGNAYWYFETFGTSEFQEIWPLIPDKVQAVVSSKKLIDHYVYYLGGKPQIFQPNEIIHFKSMNPTSMIYGQGALSASKSTVATDLFAQTWNKQFFANSARPDGVLQSDDTLDDGVRKRVAESWKQMYQGQRNHGKTAILDSGLKYQAISQNAKDMDFVNLRKDLRTEILAAFGVPPSIVGLLEYANYSNMDAQFKSFWTNTLMPEIKNIEETLTLRAKQMTFDTATIFQADLSKVQALRPDMKLLADTTQVFVNTGIPINEIIDALDLPFEHIDGGDQPRQQVAPVNPQNNPQGVPPSGSQPMDEQDAEDMADGKSIKKTSALPDRVAEWKVFDSQLRQHEAKFKSTMRGFFNGQRRRVLSKLHKNLNQFLNLKGYAGTKANTEDAVRLIFDMESENKYMSKSAGRVIKGTYFDFALETSRKLGIDFNMSNPHSIAWIKSKESKLVFEANQHTLEEITREVADAVQEAVAEGFSEGESIGAITDRINDVYDFAVDTRAERIARTETISASNAGNLQALKDGNIQKKEWLATNDEKIRDTHAELDGQIVPIDEDFVTFNGDTLGFPGDPKAPAGEVINCRCTITGITEEE
jgi:HK97 family phage portal protein